MNREIKFKALVVADGVERMVYFDLPEMDNGLWGWPMDKTINHIDEYISPLRQYIGLKDINGIEIYEGDILRRFTGYTFEVKIKEYNIGSPYHTKCFGYELHGGDEIIGTIYETPELLNPT